MLGSKGREAPRKRPKSQATQDLHRGGEGGKESKKKIGHLEEAPSLRGNSGKRHQIYASAPQKKVQGELWVYKPSQKLSPSEGEKSSLASKLFEKKKNLSTKARCIKIPNAKGGGHERPKKRRKADNYRGKKKREYGKVNQNRLQEPSLSGGERSVHPGSVKKKKRRRRKKKKKNVPTTKKSKKDVPHLQKKGECLGRKKRAWSAEDPCEGERQKNSAEGPRGHCDVIWKRGHLFSAQRSVTLKS